MESIIDLIALFEQPDFGDLDDYIISERKSE